MIDIIHTFFAAIEASSLATLVQMVEACIGVALLPAMAVRCRLVQPGWFNESIGMVKNTLLWIAIKYQSYNL